MRIWWLVNDICCVFSIKFGHNWVSLGKINNFGDFFLSVDRLLLQNKCYSGPNNKIEKENKENCYIILLMDLVRYTFLFVWCFLFCVGTITKLLSCSMHFFIKPIPKFNLDLHLEICGSEVVHPVYINKHLFIFINLVSSCIYLDCYAILWDYFVVPSRWSLHIRHTPLLESRR